MGHIPFDLRDMPMTVCDRHIGTAVYPIEILGAIIVSQFGAPQKATTIGRQC